MREQLQFRDQLDACIIAALETDGEDRACTLGGVALGEGVIPILWQAGIAHPIDGRVIGKMLGHRQRIVAMALHPERQGLDTGQNQEGVEGGERRPQITQAQHATGNGKREIAEGFAQHHLAIFRAWL